ncbi:MAG: tRNA (N(6)-L-threonylcarbamoyladenosine(37)-C(2))-methylthiotransferase MtaB [Bacteroidetes bacterium]|nr:MAG: tRNA (N(6)-L-threonylcarbamoyladenosine(37)-C(2))-methylthiotransferase MtaB [Bacteroidota bacterium]
MATPKTVSFHTLGCKLNFSETSSLAQQFRERGYGVVDMDGGSDIFVLNTCSVTDFADRKCRKTVRGVLRNNPETRVIVTGCYAQLKPEEIANIPGVDLVLGAGEKFRIVDYVERLGDSPERTWVHAGEIDEVNTFTPAHSYGDRTRSFLKVQDGCDYKCTFCTIPMARGKSRNGSIEDVIASARKLGRQGIREIVLTGVNIGDFSVADEDGTTKTFLDLIKGLDELEEVSRFRISSIEPNLCSDEIIQFVSQSKRIMPHFHMPLQSGNDKQLRMMRRRYKRELYAQRVRFIKDLIPHACIGVDMIVGFPGETDEDFLESFDFISNLDVSYLHVFTYSERPNTPAVGMTDIVPMEVRRKRNSLLRNLSKKKRLAFYHQHEGEARSVLIENSKLPGQLQGFTDNYIKVVLAEGTYTRNQLATVVLDGYNSELHAMESAP